MPPADASMLHSILTAANVDYATLSWNGFNLFGDRKSIDEAKRLLHNSDSRMPALERLLKEMKDA